MVCITGITRAALKDVRLTDNTLLMPMHTRDNIWVATHKYTLNTLYEPLCELGVGPLDSQPNELGWPVLQV